MAPWNGPKNLNRGTALQKRNNSADTVSNLTHTVAIPRSSDTVNFRSRGGRKVCTPLSRPYASS